MFFFYRELLWVDFELIFLFLWHINLCGLFNAEVIHSSGTI